MVNTINFYNCNHKFVQPETKRLLLGISNNDFIFQTIILPHRNLCSEIFYKKEDFICGVRWNTEHNRKVAVWYKNLKFECNITKKDNWKIINCIDNSIICFMKNNHLYKDSDEYNINNPTESKVQKSKSLSVLEDENWKQICEEYDNEDKQLFNYYIEKNEDLYRQIKNKEQFNKELYEELSENYCNYIESKSYQKDISQFFKNFIFAENNIENLKDYFSYDKLVLIYPELLEEKEDWVKSALKEVLEEYASEVCYIYISEQYIVNDIYDKLDERWKELIEENVRRRQNEDFDLFFKNVNNTYDLEFYWDRFYGVVEKGKVLKVDKDIFNEYFTKRNKLKLMKSFDLSEYKIVYNTLFPLYEKYILTKKGKTRPIYLNMIEHLEYFENVIKLLYENNIIEDSGDIVSVSNNENFENLKTYYNK